MTEMSDLEPSERQPDKFRVNPFDRKPLRTIASYDECAYEVTKIEKPVRGVKKSSSSNKSENFHVALPGLSTCAGHDEFEGIVPYHSYLSIKYILQNKWICLNLLTVK